MKKLKITSVKISDGSVISNVNELVLEDKALGSGGFGEVYICNQINGSKPSVPQVIKIFHDGQLSDQGYQTIQRLQDKIKLQNDILRGKGKKNIFEECPALIALPQFSYEGIFNGKSVKGYSANRLNANEYFEFEEVLSDRALLTKYWQLDLSKKLQFCLDLAEGALMLRAMSFIHADINGQNLFVNFQTGRLAIIDYDSGAVVMNPTDAPTTFGKLNEWIAPEIRKQLAGNKQVINVDLFTDTWTVAIGIHYLLHMIFPMFFFNRLGIQDMKEYFQKYKWPDISKRDRNFNLSADKSYDLMMKVWKDPAFAKIMDRMSVTINQGYENPSARTPYGQWVATLKETIKNLPAQSASLKSPGLSSPSHRSTNQPSKLTLKWTSVAGAASYQVQAASDSAFTNPILDKAGITATSYNISGLASTAVYYWRVRAENGIHRGPWSQVWNFTTTGQTVTAPQPPLLSGPMHYASNQPGNLTLSWNSSAGASSYNLQVATDSGFTKIAASRNGLSGTSFFVTGLQNNTVYYWRVSAANSAGAGQWSSVSIFSTTAAAPAPPPRRHILPAGGWASGLGKYFSQGRLEVAMLALAFALSFFHPARMLPNLEVFAVLWVLPISFYLSSIFSGHLKLTLFLYYCSMVILSILLFAFQFNEAYFIFESFLFSAVLLLFVNNLLFRVLK